MRFSRYENLEPYDAGIMVLDLAAHEALIDDDCPACVALAEDVTPPMFWHLDGCNIDEGFAFSPDTRSGDDSR